MPDTKADRHKNPPRAVRMPDGLEARVEAAAEADGASVNGFIVAAIEEKLQRREGGSTASAAPVKRGSTTRRPKAVSSARKRCTHQGTRIIGGWCGECDHMIEPGGLWKEGT